MSRLTAAFRPVRRLVIRRPWAVLALALALTALALNAARTLRIDTDFANLLPRRYGSVQALLELRDRVGAESPVDVAIESPSFAANRAYAEALIPRALALRSPGGEPYFNRVDYRRDLGVLERYAPYFATYEELDRLEAYLHEQARRVRTIADPVPESERPPVATVEDAAAGGASAPPTDVRSVLEELGLQEYPINDDSTVLALRFYPTGSQTDLGFVDALYRDLDSLTAALGPQGYEPTMRVTTAGRLLLQTTEVHAITDDVAGSFGSGVAAVLGFVVLYFFYKAVQARTGRRLRVRVIAAELARAPLTALIIGIPLLMSLSWSFGIAAAAFGSLNLLTATLGLVLFGLGIDFGIHFYAHYAEERGTGLDVEAAAIATYKHSGTAITSSALATAGALLVLTLADFRGFSEFGWIGGLGVIFALVAMLTVLPALLVIAERLRLLNLTAPRKRDEAILRRGPRVPFARALVGLAFVTIGVALALLPRVRFEYDFGKLQPAFLQYEARAQRVQQVFESGPRRNPAYLLLDDPADVPDVVAALRALAEEDSLILAVESIQERFPTDSASARQKLERLAELRALLQDPFLQLDTSGAVARLDRALDIPRPIPVDSVPDFLKRPFTDRQGRVGNFVLVYPSATLSEGLTSIRFAQLVGEVVTDGGEVVNAGSTSLVAADMLRLMQREAPRMIWITSLLVLALAAFTFRSVRWTALALFPLVVGVLMMLGAMALFDVPLTFYNLVVLPSILGIGSDCGVHLAYQYREAGPGTMMRVLRVTGEHVAAGATTNFIGFAGLLLSFHPGLRSIGLLAAIGIGTTLFAALVFVPALVQVAEDLARRRVKPRTRFREARPSIFDRATR